MVANAISRELFRNFWLGHNPAWFENDFASTSYPRYNIVEGKAGFTLEIAVPGWNKKDLKVVVKDNELRILSGSGGWGPKWCLLVLSAI